MYIKYYVISTPVERDGIDARGNQERVTSLSMNYNAIQIDGKNENLSVIDKSDASCSKDKVLVIGLGQLGLPVAKYVKDRGGFDTYGYDISTKAMDRAQKIAGIKRIGDNSTGNDGISNNNNNNNNAAYDFSEFDVFIICVSTHKPDDMFSPQIDGLLSIVEKISKEAKNGALVSIESTIPKGTSKKVFEMLNHRLHVAHAPHRWYALEQEEHGVNQLRVLGGVCQCCLDVAMQFYDGRVPINGEKGEGQAYATEIESGKTANLDNDNDNDNDKEQY